MAGPYSLFDHSLVEALNNPGESAPFYGSSLFFGMNTAYQLFPDSAAAKGQKGGSDAPTSSEQVAFAALMRGIHW